MEKTRRRKVWEVFKELQEAKSREDAERILKEYDALPVKVILQLIYHPAVEFALPNVRPDSETFKLSEEHNHPADLWRDLMSGNESQFRMFLRNHGFDTMNQMRREAKFLDYLEGIAPNDALLLLDILEDKVRSRLPFVTKELINEVYGVILPV
jgi:hypothetical protein